MYSKGGESQLDREQLQSHNTWMSKAKENKETKSSYQKEGYKWEGTELRHLYTKI